MRPHREITSCGHEDLGDDKTQVFWQGECICGWSGPKQFGSSDATKAHADYREHIEISLGHEAYYDAEVSCANCGSRHTQPILIGTHVMSHGGVCIHCGTTMLRPDNDTWHADQERMRGLFG